MPSTSHCNSLGTHQSMNSEDEEGDGSFSGYHDDSDDEESDGSYPGCHDDSDDSDISSISGMSDLGHSWTPGSGQYHV